MVAINFLFLKERTHFFESYFGVRVSSLLHSLSSVYGADITDAMHFLDVSLGRYICRRMPLPCHNGVCITYGDVVQVSENISLCSGKSDMIVNGSRSMPEWWT